MSTAISAGHEWTVEADGFVPQILMISASDTLTLSMNFDMYLAADTTVDSVDSVLDLSGNSLITSNLTPSPDKRRALFDVAAANLTASTNYRLKVTVKTSDASPKDISAVGKLKTRKE